MEKKATRRVPWLVWMLARFLAAVGLVSRSSRFSWMTRGGCSSPRRLPKVKDSDLDLVQMGRESELREWKAKLRRDLYVLRLIKGCLAVSAVGLVVGGLYVYRQGFGNYRRLCSKQRSYTATLAGNGFMTPYEPYIGAFAELMSGHGGRDVTQDPETGLNVRRLQHTCAEALKFEQVGLLFLTHEPVKNEAAWRKWFEGARGRIPFGHGRLGKCLNGIGAGGNPVDLMDMSGLVGACGVDQEAANPIESQFLFDVWVHLKKGEDSKMFRGSIFESSLIPDQYRVDSTWGGHSLIDATRVLFAAALANPFVSKMVLVSDSDVPLYGPLMVYKQLLSEPKSRVNACNTTTGWDRDLYRLRHDFIEEGISEELWRKSWQWTALERRHVHLVVQDTYVDEIFRSLCRPRWDAEWCDFRVCYSDEHYIPTLLAKHGLDHETDCSGELTDRDWSRVAPTSAHPYEYKANDISEELFESLRHPERKGCEQAMEIQSGLSGHFTTADRLVAKASQGRAWRPSEGGRVDTCQLVRDVTFNRIPSYLPLNSRCPLLARKFSRETADLVDALAGWMYGEVGRVDVPEGPM